MREHLKKFMQWANMLQGEIVLPTARTIYLAIASISLVAAVLGLLVALLMQLLTVGSAPRQRVPEVNTNAAVSIDVGAVSARLMPPKNIRFVVSAGTLHERPTAGAMLGYFDADTANGLPNYPDDFSIIGGADAELFDRVAISIPGGHRAGLAPTAGLAARIDANPKSFSQTTTHVFHLKVIARDAYGNSAASDVAVSIVTGPAPTSSEAPAPPPPVEQVTDLQRLASEIASKADSTHGVAFFDIYKRAQRVPSDCGADENQLFLGEYRRAFEGTKSLIQIGNTEGLFAGVCDAWRSALSKRAQEIAQQEAERQTVIARNMEAELKHALLVTGRKGIRNIALSLVGSALVAFITICLFLAFLAMENHTKAVREAIEAIAKNSSAER
jgi:hypothetical protein